MDFNHNDKDDLFAGTPFGVRELLIETTQDVAVWTDYPVDSAQARFLAHLIVMHGNSIEYVSSQCIAGLQVTHKIRHEDHPSSADIEHHHTEELG